MNKIKLKKSSFTLMKKNDLHMDTFEALKKSFNRNDWLDINKYLMEYLQDRNSYFENADRLNNKEREILNIEHYNFFIKKNNKIISKQNTDISLKVTKALLEIAISQLKPIHQNLKYKKEIVIIKEMKSLYRESFVEFLYEQAAQKQYKIDLENYFVMIETFKELESSDLYFMKEMDLEQPYKYIEKALRSDPENSRILSYKICIDYITNKIFKSEKDVTVFLEDFRKYSLGKDNEDIGNRYLIPENECYCIIEVLVYIHNELLENWSYHFLEFANIWASFDYSGWEEGGLGRYDKKKLKKIYNGIAKSISTARIQERNRIMANLSHTVKNMIGTIIDPLENMKSKNELQPVAIDNAIRGANLVRSLVNAMNLSFKGSIEDFQYDIQNVDYQNAASLEQMFIEALKYSISSMFDGKYFSKFMRNYFPSKPIFLKVKQRWNEISQTTDLNNLIEFMNNYMLSSSIKIDQAKDFVIGDEKGSSLKLLILIQEVIFNAVKYSSFIPQESRMLKVLFQADKENVLIKVENKYKEDVQVKSSGLGQEIINNFSKLLQTKPEIKQENGIYSVEIKFKNLWEK